MQPDLNLSLGDDLSMRVLVRDDAAVLVEATSGESAPSLWGPRPLGPYSLHDAQTALSAWDPDAGGQFSIGILHGQRLLGAVGLMPDRPGSMEMAYWTRPEERGRGIATSAVAAATTWAHRSLAIPRIWLEIRPGNEPSLRLAERAGYHFEQRLPRHCRDWSDQDAEHDSWHDCLIWAHLSDQSPATGQAAKEPTVSQINELENRLDTLTTAILLPLRASKHVDHRAMDQLSQLVTDLIGEVGDAPALPRRLTGKLWFVFTQMLSEAGHTRSPEEILDSAWLYEDQLEKLFGPWYGQGPPTPGIPRY